MTASTVGDLIEAAAQRFRAAGIAKPRREANRLWAWLHRVEPGRSFLTRDQPPPTGAGAGFEDAVARRVRGEPLAYVLGHTGFRRLTIGCDRRALIPRPETEGVVDLALERCRTGRALDLGTGTGCLALALADEGEFPEIVALDRSPAALSLARENAAVLGISLRLVLSDWTAPIASQWFDLIVANPPYLSESEMAGLDPSVGQWEPAAALAGGADGLVAIDAILAASRRCLSPGGWIVMEVDCNRADAAARMAARYGWIEVSLHRDLFGRERYLVARQGDLSEGTGA